MEIKTKIKKSVKYNKEEAIFLFINDLIEKGIILEVESKISFNLPDTINIEIEEGVSNE